MSDEALAKLQKARPNLQAVAGAGATGAVVGAQAVAEFQPMKDDTPELIRAAKKINSLGGTVERRDTQNGSPVTDITLIDSQTVQDKDLEFLKLFPDLTFLALGWTNVTNEGLKQVPQCIKLQVLGLINTKVDDAGMKEVAKLKHLNRLLLSMTSITDEGIANLGRLPELQSIMLAGTAITDKALTELAEFKNLSVINLVGTSVTLRRWQKNELREKRPDIQIHGCGQAGEEVAQEVVVVA